MAITNADQAFAAFLRKRVNGLPISSGLTATAAANAAAVVTLAAPQTQADTTVGKANVIAGISCSYSGAPTGGALTITDNGVVVYQLDIIAAGPLVIHWEPPRRMTESTQTVITLTAGGAAIVGKLNVHAWVE